MIQMPRQPDLANVALIDRGVISFTRSCESQGISIDKQHFAQLGDYLTREIDELTYKITSHIPRESLDAFTSASAEIDIDDFNVDSPDQVARLLFQHLRIGTGIELTTTASGGRISTGKKQLQRLKDEHPIIPLILQRREYTKLQNTYSNVFPRIAEYKESAEQWKIYYKIGLTFTSTGRMTCSRMHQIPSKTDLGRQIKYGFLPEPGCMFVSADFSQLELRVLAHCSEDPVMNQIYRDGLIDIHANTQNNLDMPDSMAAEHKRIVAKKLNFSCAYGTTDLGLWLGLQSEGVTCTREQCAAFIEGFYSAYKLTRPYFEKHHYRARRYGFAWNIFGRVTPAPEFRSVHRRIHREGERRIQNFVIQSAATDIFKIAAALVYDFCCEVQAGLFGRPYVCRPLLPIHDQVLLECDADIAEDVSVCVADIMSGAVELRVPLKVDASCQKRWKK